MRVRRGLGSVARHRSIPSALLWKPQPARKPTRQPPSRGPARRPGFHFFRWLAKNALGGLSAIGAAQFCCPSSATMDVLAPSGSVVRGGSIRLFSYLAALLLVFITPRTGVEADGMQDPIDLALTGDDLGPGFVLIHESHGEAPVWIEAGTPMSEPPRQYFALFASDTLVAAIRGFGQDPTQVLQQSFGNMDPEVRRVIVESGCVFAATRVIQYPVAPSPQMTDGPNVARWSADGVVETTEEELPLGDRTHWTTVVIRVEDRRLELHSITMLMGKYSALVLLGGAEGSIARADAERLLYLQAERLEAFHQ